MIDEETRRKLREMGMGEMVEAIDLQDADRTADAMPFGERVSLARLFSTHWHVGYRHFGIGVS